MTVDSLIKLLQRLVKEKKISGSADIQLQGRGACEVILTTPDGKHVLFSIRASKSEAKP